MTLESISMHQCLMIVTPKPWKRILPDNRGRGLYSRRYQLWLTIPFPVFRQQLFLFLESAYDMDYTIWNNYTDHSTTIIEERWEAIVAKTRPKIVTKSNPAIILCECLRGKEVHDNRHFGVHYAFMEILVILNFEGGRYHLLLRRCGGV